MAVNGSNRGCCPDPCKHAVFSHWHTTAPTIYGGVSRKDYIVETIFSGANGYGLTYEMRFGGDGDMPEAQFTDAYVTVWDLYWSGQKEKARAAFGALLLALNTMRQFRGVPQYMMKKRSVFKTTVSRGRGGHPAQAGGDRRNRLEFRGAETVLAGWKKGRLRTIGQQQGSAY